MKREYEKYTGPCCPGELARACIPFQIMEEVYSKSEALKKGTLFPELYKPYHMDSESKLGGKYYG